MPIKIAINGFGRIGRSVFRKITDQHPDMEIVAINDLTDTKTLAHLLKYDSLYGIYGKSVQFKEGALLVDKKEVKILGETDPLKLPWKEMEVDVVLECTGHFTKADDAGKHIQAGAKKVIISAPGEGTPTFILGVNEEKYDPKKDDVMDMGSCTTNCLAPIVKILNDNYKILRGFMTTIHAYTNDQKIQDFPHKDLRRARAAAINIIPTSTGAAKAIGKAIPELEGKLDGISMRVPVPTVSVLDLFCDVEKSTTKEDINLLLKKASMEPGLKGIFGVEDAPLVSSDYIGNSFSSVVDSGLTMVKDTAIKIVGWYDNEWAYACRLSEFAEYIGKKL